MYSSRPLSDPLSFHHPIADYLKQHSLRYDEAATGDLYSSIHVCAKCEVEVDDEFSPSAKRPIEVNVEFQIRNIFEEAWGQISHKIRYLYTRSPSVVESWHKHVYVLKMLIDGCIQYAQIIKEYSDESDRQLSVVQVATVSGADASILAHFFKRIPSNLYNCLEQGYDKLKVAENANTSYQRTKNYLEAATLFDSAFQTSLSYIIHDKDLERRFKYETRMECARCLFAAENRELSNIDKASHIYSTIRKEEETDAACRYRHGMVLLEQKDFEGAEKALLECKQLLDGGLDKNVPQGHLLHAAVRLALGTYYWAIARSSDKREGESDIAKAIRITQEGYQIEEKGKERNKFVNNLLYYSLVERGDGYVLGVEQAKSQEFCISEENLKILLEELIGAVEETPNGELQCPWLDTICRVLAWLDDVERAKPFSRRIIKHLRAKVVSLCGLDDADEQAKMKCWATEQNLRRYLSGLEFESYIYALTVAAA